MSVAPERNPAIQPQNFLPSRFTISTLTLGVQTSVTTDVDHNYCIGQLTRILIPWPFGCRQADEALGYVTSIPASNQVVIDIDSSQWDLFIDTPRYYSTPAQIMAVGDNNSGQIMAANGFPPVYIDGSFQNIS